jgi:hypothetical protein
MEIAGNNAGLALERIRNAGGSSCRDPVRQVAPEQLAGPPRLFLRQIVSGQPQVPSNRPDDAVFVAVDQCHENVEQRSVAR